MRITYPVAVSSVLVLGLLASRVGTATERIDLSRQQSGDRIAVVSGDEVSYLPAHRVELVVVGVPDLEQA